jgi:ketosteroid isomerase-like protein
MNPLLAKTLLLACLVPSRTGAQTPSDEALIRQARAASNRAIARHDVPAIVSFLADEFQVSASNGSFMRGREEMGNAFAARFAEFPDAVYVRTPDVVEVNPAGTVAAETGRWIGSWTTPGGPFRTGGRYAASWRKIDGRWLIHSELFVPLFCSGPGCGRSSR